MWRHLPVPAGSKRKVWTEPFGGYLRSIRSEEDRVERRLPDSLAYLWLRKRISSEALPQLLKVIELELHESDYKVYLSSWRVLSAFLGAPCVLGMGLLLLNVLDHSVSPRTGITELLAAAAISWLWMYLMLYRRVWRRKRQMKWFLERASSGEQTVASAETLAGAIGNDLPAVQTVSQGQVRSMLRDRWLWNHLGNLSSSMAEYSAVNHKGCRFESCLRSQ